MERSITVLTAAATMGALVIPLVFLLSIAISFFSVAVAIYLSMLWVVVDLVLAIADGVLLRIDARRNQHS